MSRSPSRSGYYPIPNSNVRNAWRISASETGVFASVITVGFLDSRIEIETVISELGNEIVG